LQGNLGGAAGSAGDLLFDVACWTLRLMRASQIRIGGALIALCMHASVARAAPQNLHITESDGPAFSFGLGMQYALIGVQGAYYYQLESTLYRVAGYVSLGILPAVADDRDDLNLGYTFGLMGSWGHKHRVLLDLSFGTIGKQWLRLHGEFVGSRVALAPGLGVGYEYMTFEGFFLRVAVGIAYTINIPIYAASDRLNFTITPIGLGLKVW
jgi:hypothetical protein